MDEIKKKELTERFTAQRAQLAEIDVYLLEAEGRLLTETRHSVAWHQRLAKLNALKKRRAVCISSMVTLRKMLNDEAIILH